MNMERSPMTRVCTKCGQNLDISHFLFARTRNRYRTECNECRNTYQREKRKIVNGVIYRFTHKNNGKVYVGQTWHFNERMNQHMRNARIGKEPCAFHNALAKYGIDGFIIDKLHENVPTQKDMDFWEKYYISEFNSIRPNGYNQTDGGSNGIPSEEVRKKGGDARCKKPVICIETGKIYKNSKDAEADTGISFTDITRSARGVVKIVGGYHWAYWHEGFQPSERHYAPEGNQGKSVVCVETGEVFGSVAEAARSVGKENPSTIFACLRGRSSYAFGFRWMKYEDYIASPPNSTSLPSVQGIGKYKPIICVETGTIYANCPDAERKTGINAGGIREACQRKNHVYAGYTWKYLAEHEETV